jgi:hypothetical protein
MGNKNETNYIRSALIGTRVVKAELQQNGEMNLDLKGADDLLHSIVIKTGRIFFDGTLEEKEIAPLPNAEKANRLIQKYLHNNYFQSKRDPLGKIGDILRECGFAPSEDIEPNGDAGRINVPIDSDEEFWLCFVWYKMESGRYEIVAYVS